MLRHLACGPALAALAAVPGAGGAAVAANTLAVSANVVASCRIWSSQDRFEPEPRVATSCTTRCAYQVSVTRGALPAEGAMHAEPGGTTVTVSY